MLRRIVEKTVDKKRLQPVRVDNLIPGMSLGTDVFAANGTFLLAKGTVINESSINLLESNYVFSVYIDEKPHVHSEREKEMLTRSERIRLSPEFAEFRRNFEATVESIEEQLNDIVFKNVETLDTEELVKKPLDLLTGYSTADIFDMLHNLRRYDDTTYVHSVNVSLISGIIMSIL
jgi:HD-GYP domain-containing protein (c-di-GMP phosphodiesterase class II)